MCFAKQTSRARGAALLLLFCNITNLFSQSIVAPTVLARGL